MYKIYVIKTISSTQTRLYLPGAGVVVGTAVVVTSKTKIQYLTESKICNYLPIWYIQCTLLINKFTQAC